MGGYWKGFHCIGCGLEKVSIMKQGGYYFCYECYDKWLDSQKPPMDVCKYHQGTNGLTLELTEGEPDEEL